MGKYRFLFIVRSLLVLSIVILLSSCGGGGGGGTASSESANTISGTVSGAILSGVTMTLSGTSSGTVKTDASGNYTFTGLTNGSYTVTPSLKGYTFNSVSEAVKVNGANITSINFTATANTNPTYSISGTVSGSILEGVTVTLSGSGSGTVATDASGNYTFTVPNGSYTVTPSLTGYTFTPASTAVTINGANATTKNFTAASSSAATYSISGTVTLNGVALNGVTMALKGTNTTANAIDSSGNYTFTGLANGSYTITPSLSGYTFTPASQAVTIDGAKVTSENFTATANLAPTYSISGTVTLGGSALPSVTMTLSGAGTGTVSTDSSGNYTFSSLANGTYTVTPTLTGYTFTQTSLSVPISGANATGKNFTATALTEPFIIAGVLSLASGSNPFSWLQQIQVYTDSTQTTPITNALVTINGTTLVYSPEAEAYNGNVIIAPGATVNLVVTIGNTICTATGTQFTTFPSITAPTSGATWQAANTNTINWTAGAPTTDASYFVEILDLPGVHTAWPTSNNIGISTSLISCTVPANSLQSGGTYEVRVGIGTAGIGDFTEGIPITNAATGSGLWIGSEAFVTITVQ